MMLIAFWMTRRQFGKVITGMKVLYPRVPKMLKCAYEIQKFEMKGIRLDMQLHTMLAALISQVNGCGCCADISRAVALRQHVKMDKLDVISDYRTSPLFSERERAALAYAEEATRNKRVSDATFDSLRKHFNETQIVEITWLNAIHNYYNLINIPLEIESDGLCGLTRPQQQAVHSSA